jgi:hypothetical protein
VTGTITAANVTAPAATPGPPNNTQQLKIGDLAEVIAAIRGGRRHGLETDRRAHCVICNARFDYRPRAIYCCQRAGDVKQAIADAHK